MKITMTAIIERQRARLNTQKAKKIAKRFYIQKEKNQSYLRTEYRELSGAIKYFFCIFAKSQ